MCKVGGGFYSVLILMVCYVILFFRQRNRLLPQMFFVRRLKLKIRWLKLPPTSCLIFPNSALVYLRSAELNTLSNQHFPSEQHSSMIFWANSPNASLIMRDLCKKRCSQTWRAKRRSRSATRSGGSGAAASVSFAKLTPLCVGSAA